MSPDKNITKQKAGYAGFLNSEEPQNHPKMVILNGELLVPQFKKFALLAASIKCAVTNNSV
jgi:hypothetical protein